MPVVVDIASTRAPTSGASSSRTSASSSSVRVARSGRRIRISSRVVPTITGTPAADPAAIAADGSSGTTTPSSVGTNECVVKPPRRRITAS